MSPRTGRPTTDAKISTFKIRLSNNDIEKLDYLSAEMKLSKAEIIRIGIDKVFSEYEKKK